VGLPGLIRRGAAPSAVDDGFIAAATITRNGCARLMGARASIRHRLICSCALCFRRLRRGAVTREGLELSRK